MYCDNIAIQNMTEVDHKGQLSRRDFLKMLAYAAPVAIFPDLSAAMVDEVLGKTKNINVDFHFVWHTSGKDLRGMEDKLKKCDVFVPEFLSWSPENEVYLNDVSAGLVTRKQVKMDYGTGFFGELLQKLYGTNKVVKLLDIPRGDYLDNEYRQIVKRKVPNYSQKFNDRKRDVYNLLRVEADWLRRREDYILDGLQKLSEETKTIKDTTTGGKLKVLMEYGVSHTRLLHLLSSDNVVDRQSSRFAENNMSYLHSGEALRRFWFADDPKDPKPVKLPDNKLISRVILEEMLMDWFFVPNMSQFSTTARSVNWMREVVNLFDNLEPEISDLWQLQLDARKNYSGIHSEDMPPELKNSLMIKLREKGLNEKYLKNAIL